MSTGADTYQALLAHAGRALDDAGVRWCLLRPPDVDDVTREHDLLVQGPPAAVARALAAAGFVPERAWGRAPHRLWLGADPDVPERIKLDLVDELAFGPWRELRLPGAGIVLDGARREGHDGVPVPAPADACWLILLHSLADRGRLTERHRRLLERWEPGPSSVADALDPDLRRQLGQLAADGRWDDLETLASELRRRLAKGQRVAAAARTTTRRLLRATTPFQRAVLRPGTRVALLGSDGAGKSTVAAALTAQGTVKAVVYLGMYPAGQRAGGRLPGLGLVHVIGRMWRGWLEATWNRRRGWDVLLDRHPLEAAVAPPANRAATRLRRAVLSRCLPRPELVVVLDAPAETLHQRKPEHSLEDLARRRDRYLTLARDTGAAVVDTTAPLPDVCAEIAARMLQARLDPGRSRR